MGYRTNCVRLSHLKIALVVIKGEGEREGGRKGGEDGWMKDGECRWAYTYTEKCIIGLEDGQAGK